VFNYSIFPIQFSRKEVSLQPPAPPPPVKPINWPVLGGIIAAVVVAAVLAPFLIRKEQGGTR